MRAMQMERATEEQEREADEQEQRMEYDRLAQELEACQKMVRRTVGGRVIGVIVLKYPAQLKQAQAQVCDSPSH